MSGRKRLASGLSGRVGTYHLEVGLVCQGVGRLADIGSPPLRVSVQVGSGPAAEPPAGGWLPGASGQPGL